MAALRRWGIDVYGVDISHEAAKFVATKKLPFQRFDLRGPDRLPGEQWDLVVCCEVAEHLQEKYAATLVTKLTQAGKIVFMTAAEPGPEEGLGLYHYNEKPNEYWIRLMENAGWQLDEQATNEARKHFISNGVISYLCKVMIFRPGPLIGNLETV